MASRTNRLNHVEVVEDFKEEFEKYGSPVFNKETDSEKVAMDIVKYLRKWGMWQDVQIFIGGKCYTDGEQGELKIRNEEHPEKYLKGLAGQDCNGEPVWKDYSNPERLLDMTFEGAFSLLLRHHEYEVRIGELSEEAKHIIIPETSECQDEVAELMDEYLKGNYGWDPAEYDSYEEWFELNQYHGMDLYDTKSNSSSIEFSSKEAYEDFLLRSTSGREANIREYFEDELCDDTEYDEEIFFDDGRIANLIIHEFNKLLEKYGLWYELGFSWSLTAYFL